MNQALREEYIEQPVLRKNRLYDILPEEVLRQMQEAAEEKEK